MCRMVKRALGNQKDIACWVVKWVLNSQKVADYSILTGAAPWIFCWGDGFTGFKTSFGKSLPYAKIKNLETQKTMFQSFQQGQLTFTQSYVSPRSIVKSTSVISHFFAGFQAIISESAILRNKLKMLKVALITLSKWLF